MSHRQSWDSRFYADSALNHDPNFELKYQANLSVKNQSKAHTGAKNSTSNNKTFSIIHGKKKRRYKKRSKEEGRKISNYSLIKPERAKGFDISQRQSIIHEEPFVPGVYNNQSMKNSWKYHSHHNEKLPMVNNRREASMAFSQFVANQQNGILNTHYIPKSSMINAEIQLSPTSSETSSVNSEVILTSDCDSLPNIKKNSRKKKTAMKKRNKLQESSCLSISSRLGKKKLKKFKKKKRKKKKEVAPFQITDDMKALLNFDKESIREREDLLNRIYTLLKRSSERIPEYLHDLHFLKVEQDHYKPFWGKIQQLLASMQEHTFPKSKDDSRAIIEILKMEHHLYQHKSETVTILEMIDRRETYLYTLYKFVQRFEKVGYREFDQLSEEVSILVNRLKDKTLYIVEHILVWRNHQPPPLGSKKPFFWKKIPYLLKIQHDMDFFWNSHLAKMYDDRSNAYSNKAQPLHKHGNLKWFKRGESLKFNSLPAYEHYVLPPDMKNRIDIARQVLLQEPVYIEEAISTTSELSWAKKPLSHFNKVMVELNIKPTSEKEEHRKKHKAALTLQRVYKGYKARQLLKLMKREKPMVEGTGVIRRPSDGETKRLLRRTIREQGKPIKEKDKKELVNLVQNSIRMHLAQTKHMVRYLSRDLAAKRIQRSFRCHQSKQWLVILRAERHSSLINNTIIPHFKGYVVACNVSHQIHVRNSCIVKLQKLIRTRLTILRYLELIEKQTSAVNVISRNVRGFLARRLASRKRKMRGILNVQNLIRARNQINQYYQSLSYIKLSQTRACRFNAKMRARSVRLSGENAINVIKRIQGLFQYEEKNRLACAAIRAYQRGLRSAHAQLQMKHVKASLSQLHANFKQNQFHADKSSIIFTQSVIRRCREQLIFKHGPSIFFSKEEKQKYDASLVLQKFARMKLSQIYLRNRAGSKILRAYRNYTSRVPLLERRRRRRRNFKPRNLWKKEDYAAATLQSYIRGFFTRKITKKLSKERYDKMYAELRRERALLAINSFQAHVPIQLRLAELDDTTSNV
mmetsp:Transcript_1745/g.2580  ORF Transcript_1745/g.2580 Transcript_1745/m.2580 type:complete len:1031 (+) Transcript_1745:94-3186(+)